jgi:hypothetical protein
MWKQTSSGFHVLVVSVMPGFETSAQFVEAQAPGVFLKTLRNMWWGVIIFNPLVSVLALGVLPLDTIHANEDTVSSSRGGSTVTVVIKSSIHRNAVPPRLALIFFNWSHPLMIWLEPLGLCHVHLLMVLMVAWMLLLPCPGAGQDG